MTRTYYGAKYDTVPATQRVQTVKKRTKAGYITLDSGERFHSQWAGDWHLARPKSERYSNKPSVTLARS